MHSTGSRQIILPQRRKWLFLSDFVPDKYWQYNKELYWVFGIIFHNGECRIGIVVFLLVKTNISVIIVGINIMNVFGQLADGVEKRLGKIKILLNKIGIPLVKFQGGDFLVTQVFNT